MNRLSPTCPAPKELSYLVHEPFFFGPSHRQLFGVYHPPVGVDSNVLTVICPPFLSELGRTHSLLGKLACSLAEQGQHVLRIDYSGTGDSFGRLREVTISDWAEDIKLAMQEGRELTGCSAMRILAVRASALLACKAVDTGNDIERLVLWDPIFDGAQYLQSLMHKQATMLEKHCFLSRAEQRKLIVGYNGMYHLSDRMPEEIRSLDASTCSSILKSKMLIVRTSSENEPPMQGASEHILQIDCGWEGKVSGLIISQPLLEVLTLCLTKL
jgi:hypothetical protein